MTRTCKLNCTVQHGMFRGEYLAKLTAINSTGENKDVHVFVNESCLMNIDSSGKGKAQLLATAVSKSGSHVGVVLPQPTFENGPSLLVPATTIAR